MGAAGGRLRTAHSRQERPKGRKIGRKAAPARKRMGSKPMLRRRHRSKKKKVTTAGPPITRRTPNRQDKPAARGAFSATIDRPAVSLKGYVYQVTHTRRGARIWKSAQPGARGKPLKPRTPRHTAGARLSRLCVVNCIQEQGMQNPASLLRRGCGKAAQRSAAEADSAGAGSPGTRPGRPCGAAAPSPWTDRPERRGIAMGWPHSWAEKSGPARPQLNWCLV
jgi:hypothetical protein